MRSVKIHFLGRIFAPSLTFWILFITGFCTFIALGIWQLERAKEKEQRIEQYQRESQYAPVSFEKLSSKDINRQVIAKGRWLEKRLFIQDNVLQNGVSGFSVLSAFELLSNQVVLVDRGWKAWGIGSKTLPDLPPLSSGIVEIAGRTALPLRRFSLSGDIESAAWPKIMQVVDTKDLQKYFSKPLATSIIHLESSQNDGLLRQWKVVYGDTRKHRGYALQWFTFALVLMVLFVALNSKKSPP